MFDTSFFFYWLDETAASCYSGVDLGKGLGHYSLSRLTDGTPHSSSDLPYFTLLFTWTNYFRSNSLSPFFFLDKIFLSPIPSLFSSDKNTLSPTSILQNYSKPIPNSVSRKIISISQKISKSLFLSDLENFLFCLHCSYYCRWSLNSVP